ncbi:MAG: streptomycin 6-kinase [Actinomycetota bacterium]|nr:streptomycin 6-kinase [Actinomycetota bacterium]
MSFVIPAVLTETCNATPERSAWLERLPAALGLLRNRWSLTVGAPFEGEDVTSAWVAPATRSDGTPAILKLGMPHMEAEREIDGLRFWDGNPTVQLLEADDDLNAMLLERCEPGTSLRSLPEPEQDIIVAGLLQQLWRTPSDPHPFRSLGEMTALWGQEAIADSAAWPDAGLVREGLRLFEELPRSAPTEVVLATDLHAGNILRAAREPWLVIDPKPFVGDPAYDATQHLFNCSRLLSDPIPTIRRFADLLELDPERVQLWTFARAAVESGDEEDEETLSLARALAP